MEKQLPNLPSGATLIVLATDPMARIDIPLFCRQNGYACAIDTDAEGVMAFTIRKSN